MKSVRPEHAPSSEQRFTTSMSLHWEDLLQGPANEMILFAITRLLRNVNDLAETWGPEFDISSRYREDYDRVEILLTTTGTPK